MNPISRRSFAAAVTLPLALSPARAQAPSAAARWDSIPHWMELASVPGAVVAIIAKGKLAGIHPFGVCRTGEPPTIDDSTVFEAASLSKPVFASAILKLVRDKALDLDRPLHQILPLCADPRAQVITARHVLSHTTGLQNWRNQRSPEFTFAFPAGEKFSYSGEGYFYLQRVVEKITATPFARYMRETVLAPLAMARSSYIYSPGPNSASPHDSRLRPFNQVKAGNTAKMAELATEWKKPREDWLYEDLERAMPRLNLPVLADTMQPTAAAALMTTASDSASFLLHAFSLDAMRQPQVRINSDLSWGLGCGLETSGGRQWFWHWGDNPGFKNFFIADAKSGDAALVFTNADGGAKLYQRIVRQALDRDFSAFLWI